MALSRKSITALFCELRGKRKQEGMHVSDSVSGNNINFQHCCIRKEIRQQTGSSKTINNFRPTSHYCYALVLMYAHSPIAAFSTCNARIFVPTKLFKRMVSVNRAVEHLTRIYVLSFAIGSFSINFTCDSGTKRLNIVHICADH